MALRIASWAMRKLSARLDRGGGGVDGKEPVYVLTGQLGNAVQSKLVDALRQPRAKLVP